jgi:hypothetical protein
MAVVAETSRVVPVAGEVLGVLERWGRGWNPGCSQHHGLTSRARTEVPSVAVLGRRGTRLFRTHRAAPSVLAGWVIALAGAVAEPTSGPGSRLPCPAPPFRRRDPDLSSSFRTLNLPPVLREL